MRAWVQLLLVCVIVGACSEITGIDNPNVELRTERDSYSLGERGTLLLLNLHREELKVTHSMCGSTIQQLIEGEWKVVGTLGNRDPHDGTALTICYAYAVSVPPKQTLTTRFDVDHRFEAGGVYRFLVEVAEELPGPMHLKASASFTVHPL